MSVQRLSLSSPEVLGRIKKFDTYDSTKNRTYRAVRRKQVTSITPAKNHQLRSVKQVAVKSKKPTVVHRNQHVAHNSVAKQDSSKQQIQNLAMRVVGAVKFSRRHESGADIPLSYFVPTTRKLTKLQLTMYGFGTLVFIFAAFTSVQTFMTNNQAQGQINTLGANETTDEQGVAQGTGKDPSEQQVSAASLAAYVVSNPEHPRYLRIPEIGVEARIKSLGIDSVGAVDAPWNIHDVGWYSDSARPGNAVGSSLLLGHVSGWSGPGVFKNITKLHEGSRFEVEKGSGEIVHYEVTRGEQIPLEQVNMGKILGTEIAGEHDLKLMTCGGRYNRETETYVDRYVIYARQV